MSKRINLAATISTVLADKNSSFYQNEPDENQFIDDGKKIREAFFKAGKSAQKVADEMRSFHDYIESWKKQIYSAFDCSKYIQIPRRTGKSILRGK